MFTHNHILLYNLTFVLYPNQFASLVLFIFLTHACKNTCSDINKHQLIPCVFFQLQLADATWTDTNATVAAARARSAQLTSRAATAARQVSMRTVVFHH